MARSTRHLARRRRRESNRRGVLSFEWILLISLLVIGIIGGLSAVRNSLLSELSDLANAVEAINVCGNEGEACPTSTGDVPNPVPENDPWWEP